MAFGIDRSAYLIKEGRITIGDWAPGSITTTDPVGSGFTSDGDMGDFQQGTLSPQLTREYADFLVGTPGKLTRKDLIRKQWMWSATFAQYNTDLMALVQGLDVELGDYDIGWVGSDEVLQGFNGYTITTERVDATPFILAQFYAKVTATEVGPTFPGTAHSTYNFMSEAFEHPYYITNSDDTHNYGFIALGPTPS